MAAENGYRKASVPRLKEENVLPGIFLFVSDLIGCMTVYFGETLQFFKEQIRFDPKKGSYWASVDGGRKIIEWKKE